MCARARRDASRSLGPRIADGRAGAELLPAVERGRLEAGEDDEAAEGQGPIYICIYIYIYIYRERERD